MLVRPFFTDWAQLLEAHLRNATRSGTRRIADRAFRRRLGAAAARRCGACTSCAPSSSAASGIGAALDETEQAAPEALEAVRSRARHLAATSTPRCIDAFLHDSPPQAAEVTQSLQGWIADPAQHRAAAQRQARRAHAQGLGQHPRHPRRRQARASPRRHSGNLRSAKARRPPRMRAQALMSAADCLEQMVATVAGEDSAPENALAVIELLDAARSNDASDTVRQRALEPRRRLPPRLPQPATPAGRAPKPRRPRACPPSCSTTSCAWWARSRSRSASSSRN